jgi:transposase
MAGFPQLTPHKKAVLVVLWNEGLSTYDITTEVHCNQSTVVRLLKKLAEGRTVARKFGTGVKPVSNPNQDQVFKQISLWKRTASSAELKREWDEMTDVKASVQTVRR